MRFYLQTFLIRYAEGMVSLNRTYSLKRHKEFRYTYRAGRRVGGRNFSLVWARNRVERLQVGFSVSKKVGNSVERNRCKRRLKAAFDPWLLKVKPGQNLIFIGRREALYAPFSQLEKDMEHALKKAGLLLEEGLSSEEALRR